MLTPILCVVIIVPWLAAVITRWLVNRPERIRWQLPTEADAFDAVDRDFIRGHIADSGAALLLTTVQSTTSGGFSPKQSESMQKRAAALDLGQCTSGTFPARHEGSVYDLAIEFTRVEPGLLDFTVLTVPPLAERIAGMLKCAFGEAGLLLQCEAPAESV